MTKHLYNVDDVIDYHVFKVLKRSTLSIEELRQVAYSGYSKAIQNYNPEYGKMTLLYASRCIKTALNLALNKDYKYVFNKGASISSGDGDGDSTYTREGDINENQLASEDYYISDRDHDDIARKLSLVLKHVNKLTDVQRRIILDYYTAYPQRNLKQIAEEMGVTKQRVCQIKKLALNTLRELVEEDTNND